jgi:hypothetical protein
VANETICRKIFSNSWLFRHGYRNDGNRYNKTFSNSLQVSYSRHLAHGQDKLGDPDETRVNCLFGSNEGKEHIEGNLDSIDKDKTMLGFDELEVEGMDNGPDLPRSLASTEKVVLDLASDDGHGVAVDQAEVGEEDGHEDGAVM